MATLNLVRGLRIEPDGDGVQVVVEDHHRLGDGYVCELVLEDPDDPLSPFRREYSRRLWTDRRGKSAVGHYRLADGLFEAKSVRKAGVMPRTFFAVARGTIEILADADEARCRLSGIDGDELSGLREARERTPDPSGMPRLVGTPSQREFGSDIRRRRLSEAGTDETLIEGIASVRSALFWITTRGQSLEQLRPRLAEVERRARRAALGPEPGPF